MPLLQAFGDQLNNNNPNQNSIGEQAPNPASSLAHNPIPIRSSIDSIESQQRLPLPEGSFNTFNRISIGGESINSGETDNVVNALLNNNFSNHFASMQDSRYSSLANTDSSPFKDVHNVLPVPEPIADSF